jgi:hypothetical protein
MSFGLPLPADIVNPASTWGARAILSRGDVDLLPDRQQLEPAVPHSMLITWLNTFALPKLRAMSIDPAGDKMIRIDGEGFDRQYGLVACANRSHGYLYIRAWRKNPEGSQYELMEAPETARNPSGTLAGWSSKNPVPKIGDHVEIHMNGFGGGTVLDYFVECNWLGVRVLIDKCPAWFAKQHPDRNWAMVFGVDLDARTPAVAPVAAKPVKKSTRKVKK